MASESATVRELLTFTLDGEWGLDPVEPHPYATTEMRIIRGTDFDAVQSGAINSVPIRAIRADIAERKSLQDGDVLIETAGGSAKRSTGRVCLITETLLESADRPVTCASFARFLRFDKKKINPEFAYWSLQNLYSCGVMAEHQVQHTGIARFQFTKFAEAQSLYLPPLNHQIEAVVLLRAIQARIFAFTLQNQTLEAIARAIFKSWFVDFDPLRAKAEGREPDRMDASVAALFTGEFQDSELGEIPKGWSVCFIGECAEIVGGSTPSTTNSAYWEGGEYCWATPKDLSLNKSVILLDTERKITSFGLAGISSGLLPVGTVLMSSRAPIGYISLAQVPTAINQGFIAMKPLGGMSNIFLLLWTEYAMDTIKSLANGSTFQEISKKNFRTIRLVRPDDATLSAFDNLVQPQYERITVNAKRIQTLTELRATLLPRLISGKLRVRDAAKMVEAVI